MVLGFTTSPRMIIPFFPCEINGREAEGGRQTEGENPLSHRERNILSYHDTCLLALHYVQLHHGL